MFKKEIRKKVKIETQKKRFLVPGNAAQILQRLKVSGIEVPPQIFDEVVDVNL